MADTSWRDRIERGRTLLQNRGSDVSANARAAAEGAGARISGVYGQARAHVGEAAAATRGRAADLAGKGAARAGTLGADAREISAEALKRGRDTLGKAAIASRGLVAERPLTAVVVGIGAGILLGALANRLGRTRPAETPDDAAHEDEWYQ